MHSKSLTRQKQVPSANKPGWNEDFTVAGQDIPRYNVVNDRHS